MTSGAGDALHYRWQWDDAIQIYRTRAVRRYMVCPLGGYYIKLERLADDTVVAIFKGGDAFVGQWGHLQCAHSRDGGESWTPPRPIAQMAHDTDHAAFGQTADGTLILCFVQPHAYKDGTWDTGTFHLGPVYMVKSTDGGLSWTAPATVDTSSAPLPNQCNPHGHIVQLADGTLLMAMYAVGPDEAGQRSYTRHDRTFIYLIRSRDGGNTWGDVQVVRDDGFVEPTLYVLPSGRVLALMAHFLGNRDLWQMASDDGGQTWSEPQRLTGYYEYPGSSLLRLHDGRLLLAYGHRTFPGGVHAMVSRDDGQTWDTAQKIVLAAESVYQWCGGGSSVQLADGHILTSYYVHQGTGPFQHPRPYWVTSGHFSGPYAAVVKYTPADLP